jgi:hypothetical protein
MLVGGFPGKKMKRFKMREISGTQLRTTLPTEAIARRGFGPTDMAEYQSCVQFLFRALVSTPLLSTLSFRSRTGAFILPTSIKQPCATYDKQESKGAEHVRKK